MTELRRRGVVFEDVDVPALRTGDGIAAIERNLLGFGQAVG